MKNLIILIVVLAAIGGGYYLYQKGGYQAAPGETPPPAGGSPTPAPSATPPPAADATHTIAMDANGFSPATLGIRVGDTVVFRNDDTRTRWPASGLHPTHLLCAGFDALKPLATNETYSYTFTAAKECPMHDHLIPSIRGKITVIQ